MSSVITLDTDVSKCDNIVVNNLTSESFGIQTFTNFPVEVNYNDGDSLEITATPKTGCTFVGYLNNDVFTDSNPLDISPTGNFTLLASFTGSYTPPAPEGIVVLSKVKDILIGSGNTSTYTWIGISDVELHEDETTVALPLTKNVYSYQDILPFRVEGIITCIDPISLKTALYMTNIDVSGNKAVVLPNMKKHKVSYFLVRMLDSTIAARYISLTNFRVKNIEIVSIKNLPSSETPKFLVHFYADSYEHLDTPP